MSDASMGQNHATTAAFFLKVIWYFYNDLQVSKPDFKGRQQQSTKASMVLSCRQDVSTTMPSLQHILVYQGPAAKLSAS